VDQEKGLHTARDLVEADDVLLTLWRGGRVSRTAKAPPLSSEAIPVAQVWGNTRDDVAFFTAKGQTALVPIHQVPDNLDAFVSQVTDLDRSETVIGALVLPHPPPGEELPGSYLTLVTRGGRIKRVTLADLASSAGRGASTIMSVEGDDELAWVVESGGLDELLLVTRQAKAIRFSEDEVRPMGLSAGGVLAIKLGKDDGIIGMGIIEKASQVVTFSERGYAKRTAGKAFPTQKRYGSGVLAAKISSETGPLAAAVLASEGQSLVLMTAEGRATKVPVKSVPSMGRTAMGNRSPKGIQEPYLEPDIDGPPLLLTVLAGTKSTAERTRT
jgi:DNA gyrase subunit A